MTDEEYNKRYERIDEEAEAVYAAYRDAIVTYNTKMKEVEEARNALTKEWRASRS